MALTPKIIALAALALPSLTFAQQIADPANLMGERVTAPSPADTLEINHGPAALQQLLKKLRTRASLMLIVAHPDDEDGGMLTYESRGQGARVAMLTLTRGEGGQNLMSADFNDALGLIRTQELLAADRYLGVDQFFGTEVDFGFSKTKEETLAQWTHDRVLYDAVRSVRLYRPLVLASVFVGGVTDGHGQHQVSGEITQEVFLAAADPKVFPEMGLPPWAPAKVYARVPFSRVTDKGMFDYATGKYAPPVFHNYVTGRDITHEPLPTVEIPEGEVSHNLGMEGLSYVQFARKGLGLQKTQIGTNVRLPPAGAFDSGYTLMASRVGCPPSKTRSACPLPATEHSLFEGIDTSLPGLLDLVPNLIGPPRTTLGATLKTIDHELAEAQSRFDPGHLELVVDPLLSAMRSLDSLIDDISARKGGALPSDQTFNLLHELRVKRVQLNNALTLALGLTFQPRLFPDAHTPLPSRNLIANEVLRIDAGFSGVVDERFHVDRIETETPPGILGKSYGGQINLTVTKTLSPQPPPTRPYFSRPSLTQPFYDVTDHNLRNAPMTPSPLVDVIRFSYQGVPLEMRGSVQPPDTPAAIVAVPALSISLFPRVGILPLASSNEDRLTVTAVLRTSLPGSSGTISLDVPSGWRVEPKRAPYSLAQAGDEQRIIFTLIPSTKLVANQPYSVTALAEQNGQTFRESFRSVGYPGLTYTNEYVPATCKITAIDVHTAPNLRVAYLPGTGDTVADFLPNLDITPTILTATDLTAANLAKYDAVVLGVRAYAAHPELAGKGSKPLGDFASAGGVVIVQYNSAGSSGDAAPYPFTLPGDSAHNVVEESDPVTFLAPRSPILNWPNKLTAADFTRWAEEWGHGFASTWDPHYQSILEVHDPGQDPQRGGLLLAPVGKGAYIYCALALYRQLPESVPGAYRLLANLLSLGKNPGFPQNIQPAEAAQ